MTISFEGQVALVTGAASGLGWQQRRLLLHQARLFCWQTGTRRKFRLRLKSLRTKGVKPWVSAATFRVTVK
jgi:NAD(P)-dependent dehydrogenase (short-subunit alcohol dehydrogenase family)